MLVLMVAPARSNQTPSVIAQHPHNLADLHVTKVSFWLSLSQAQPTPRAKTKRAAIARGPCWKLISLLNLLDSGLDN